MYIDQTLRGTCFDELLPDERFIWFGFLLLAGDNAIEGKISVTENTGFSFEQLSDLLKCDIELIQRAIDKMIKHDKIKINKSNVIYISNWEKYQSEYQRQRNYREEYKKRKELQRKVTTTCINKSDNAKLLIDRDIDIEEDKDKEKIIIKSPAYKLSELLLKKIKENNPNYKKPDLDNWSVHINRMIRIDKRKPDKIREVIDWCQQDNFWHKNILSTEKLRKQYDQLIVNMPKQKQDWRTT